MYKSLTHLLLFLLLNTTLSAQVIDREFPEADGSLKLLGEVSYERLTATPFDIWFVKNESDYLPSDKEKTSFSKALASTDSITIFMGTWCGDSKREVPRFTKLLKQSGYDMSKLKIVCVDNTFASYKQSPEKQQQGLNIHRVPTFIFHKGQNETGRIVEHPVKSFGEDLIRINEGNYIPAYQAADFLHRLLEKDGLAALENEADIIEKLRPMTEEWYELTTYGKVLLTSWQLKEAIKVLEINSKLFPEEEYAQLHLANAYYLYGDYEKTATCCQNALTINPNSSFASSLMTRIKKKNGRL